MAATRNLADGYYERDRVKILVMIAIETEGDIRQVARVEALKCAVMAIDTNGYSLTAAAVSQICLLSKESA